MGKAKKLGSEELIKILDDHKLWLKSEGMEGKRANLQKADLDEANLEGADFEKADLKDVILTKAKLITDKITAAKFPEETLTNYGKTFFVESYEAKSPIVRSIEFPPEYHQAGISILNYFGTVLRKKYPDQKAKFRIEQEERKVTMIIDTEEGDREIIEKSLDEYGLVITGQMTPEQVTNDRQLLMELKTELRVAQVRIEAQKDIIEYQRSDLTGLYKLLDTGLRHPAPIEIQTTATSTVQSDIKFSIEMAP